MDARVIDDRIEYRGAMRAKLATGNLEGSVLPVTTSGGPRITAASPLRLSASIELARLATLAGLTDATMRFDGRAKAAFTARGTLREPLLTGTVEQASPVRNRGRWTAQRHAARGTSERELRVQSFAIRGGDAASSERRPPQGTAAAPRSTAGGALT